MRESSYTINRTIHLNGRLKPVDQITDRAKRYRAEKQSVPGPEKS